MMFKTKDQKEIQRLQTTVKNLEAEVARLKHLNTMPSKSGGEELASLKQSARAKQSARKKN